MNKDIKRLARYLFKHIEKSYPVTNTDGELHARLRVKAMVLENAIAAEPDYKEVEVWMKDGAICTRQDDEFYKSNDWTNTYLKGCKKVTLLEPVTAKYQGKYTPNDKCECKIKVCSERVQEIRNCRPVEPDWLKPPKKTDYKEPVEAKAEIKELKSIAKYDSSFEIKWIRENRDKLNEHTKAINAMRKGKS